MEPVTDRPPDGRIEISLFGDFRVRVGPSLLQLPTRKAQALVAYLALTPGRVHDRERVHALLWPESGKVQAQASLRQTLLTIRKSLSFYAPRAMRSTDATIALDDSQVQVDVTTLERCVADATLEALEHITSLCAGPFLDGFAAGSAPFDEWIGRERARLQEVVGEALEKLAELQAGAGRVDRAIQTTLHSLRLEPLQERTHRALMRLYAMHGRRAEAVQQYATCAATLERELGVEPEEQTKQLHRDLLRESVAISAVPRGPTVAPPNPVLVGRDAEVRDLDEALEEAWTGSSRLVLLTGDAGVGKTRLLEAMACKAAERGGIDIRGRCFESERVLPFALWADLLRSEHASLDRTMSRMSSASRAEISRILPRVGGSGAPPPPSSNDARALFEAVGELLTRMADGAPLLVLLEDLHWADAMSVRLLSFLARRFGRSSRVCLVATVRAEEMAGATLLRALLQEIDREQLLLEVPVAPLSREDTRALLRSLAPRAEAMADSAAFDPIWALSEGNPLVVVEAVRGLELGAIPPDVTRLPVPLRVRDLIASHVARLGRFSQEVVATAAVIGRRFDFTLLARACNSSDRLLAATVEDLVRSRLLQSSGEEFYFTHDRIREVVYESLLSPRRRLLHGAVARAMEDLWADRLDDESGSIGYHFARAGEAADAVRHLLRFADRSTRNCGLEEALAALEEARHQSAALLGPCRDAALVETAIRRAVCLLYLGRISEMDPTLAPHRATLERLDDPILNASFHSLTAFAHASVGDRRGAQEHETRLLIVAEKANDGLTAGLALSQASFTASRTGEFARGIEQGLKAVAKLEACDDPEATGFAWANLGTNYLFAGDWQPALDAYARASAIGERAACARVQAIGAAGYGIIACACRGDFDAGLAACRRAVSVAPDPYSAFYAHWSLARAAANVAMFQYAGAPPLAAGRPVLDDTFRASLKALETYADASSDDSLRVWSGTAMVALAEGHLAANNLERARAYALGALGALPEGDPMLPGMALRALGRVELASGHFDASRERLTDALRRFELIGARMEVAGTVFALAGVAITEGDAVAAAGYCGDAYRRASALGLTFWSALLVRIAGAFALAI
jgi:DNA-binding SARP family transcriptional activator/tetratricopeptide (TPR) repeat protein